MHVKQSARWGFSGPGLADLPIIIWPLIQEHMKLKDWVRAAGTCKASWAVQLKALKTSSDDCQDTSGVHSSSGCSVITPVQRKHTVDLW